jgi:hypothetical protein
MKYSQVPSFIKIGSGIQKLLAGDTRRQHGDCISLLLENRLEMEETILIRRGQEPNP